MSDSTRPDAVIIPDGWKSGDNAFSRLHSVLAHSERILGVSKVQGEQAHARPHHAGSWFCTRDRSDTINFPTNHERSGVPRYTWSDQPDGSKIGQLVPEAKEAAVATA